MGKKNYNKMFKPEPEPVVETPVLDEVVEEVIEEAVEQVEVEAEVEPEPEPELNPENVQLGKVVDCAQLNVRTEPSLSAELATDRPLKRNAELMIYPDESTDDFYKICTESGINGYCLKKFIEIQ
jgi:hypothetical protein